MGSAKYGITEGIQYFVKNAKNKLHKNADLKLILVQNTQNEEEWTGDWGRESNLWGDGGLVYKDLPPGTFYMPFEKYLKLFTGTCICRDSWNRANY